MEQTPLLRPFLFSFPELLLAVVGAQLILGRYTWMRFTELFRFKALRQALKKK
jgi:hypothetical protein